MRRRRGFSLPELLTAVVIVALLALLVLPLTTELRERTALRSARLELASAFAAARAAAVQKGKSATVTLEGSTISVTVMSGAPPHSIPMLGPLKLDRASGTTVRPLASAPTVIQYDARGLVTPTSTATSRYELRSGRRADTVCLTGAGAVMPRGCVL